MFFLYIADRICGDKCTGETYGTPTKIGTCQCGNYGVFDYRANHYCCIPKNATCIKEGLNVKCPEGKKYPLKKFCEPQKQCPIALQSLTAISTNCTYKENQHCPDSSLYSSKICANDTSLNFKVYCHGNNMCNQAISGLDYQQCYRK